MENNVEQIIKKEYSIIKKRRKQWKALLCYSTNGQYGYSYII